MTIRHAKALAQYDWMDQLPGDLREVVMEFGPEIVKRCVDYGIREPRHIRALVYTIWDGARTAYEDKKKRAFGTLDWLLVQHGCPVPAATLIGTLKNASIATVPLDPTGQMVQASMDRVTWDDGKMSKAAKHKKRLRAGIEIGTKQLMRKAFEE